MLAGPYGSMLLADMGAEVIKIEDPDGGDPMRVMGPPFLADGESGRAPVRMGLPMGDLTGGIFGAFAVAGALFRRERTGEGAHLDLSLLDCQVSLLTYIAQYFWTNGRVPGPLGSSHASVVPYQAPATPHPVHGKLPALGTPVKVDGAMGLETAPPPTLGEHTEAVLGGVLEYSAARIAELRAAGVVA